MQKNLLGEHDLVFFTTYLFVTISRIRRKYELTGENYIGVESNENVSMIMDELEKSLQIRFTDGERSIIKKIYRSFGVRNKVSSETGTLSQDILVICKNIDIIYGTKFVNDPQLLEGIVNHINTYFSKVELNLNFTEEIVKEIRTTYPLCI